MVRVVRVRLDERLVLGLTAALQVRIAQVQAVLVDLDVRALVIRTPIAAAREVRRPARVRAADVVPVLAERERCEAGDDPGLDVVELVVDPEGPAAYVRGARVVARQRTADEQDRNERERDTERGEASDQRGSPSHCFAATCRSARNTLAPKPKVQIGASSPCRRHTPFGGGRPRRAGT